MAKSETGIGTVLCVGPQGMPRTGQALATDTWVASSAHKVFVINNNFEGQGFLKRLVRTLILPLQVFWWTWSVHPSAMYLSIKRSMFGAAADLACVFAYRLVVAAPVVVHLHGADLVSARKFGLTNALFRLLWRVVTDVIVLVPRMTEQLQGLPQRRVHVVNNFSEAFATANSVAEKAATYRGIPLRVLYLSNILFSKGFLFLVDAVKMLRADGYLVTLTLAGRPLSDSYMSAEESLTLLRGMLGDGIDYLGPVCGTQKWQLLETAHVVALPTFYPTEAQPISLIEGMAHGCIPLTTYHNYNVDFLDSSTAIFVEKQNAEAIAEALRTLITNPGGAADRMRHASAIAFERYCVKQFVDEIDRVLESAIKRTTRCNFKKTIEQATFADKSGTKR